MKPIVFINIGDGGGGGGGGGALLDLSLHNISLSNLDCSKIDKLLFMKFVSSFCVFPFKHSVPMVYWYRIFIFVFGKMGLQGHLQVSCSYIVLYCAVFIYLGFYVAFDAVQVISQRVVLWAEETSTYSWSRFCTVNCWPLASNYQQFHICLGCEQQTSGGRRVSYHCATEVPLWAL